MNAVLAVTLPFFALVLCGYLAARTRLLPAQAVPGLNAFVLYFALPCMLLDFGRRTPVAQLFSPAVAALWLVCAAIVVALAVGVARRLGGRWPDAGMGALVAAFPNSGFMGVPLIAALLGEAAVAPVMATLALDLIVVTSVCIGLAHLGPQPHASGGAAASGTAPAEGAAQAMRRALRGMVRNPLPWAILLGALLNVLHLEPWAPVTRTVQLLGSAASPVALFTLGAVLAQSQQRMVVMAYATALGDVMALVVIKLLLHPALVAGLGALAVHQGWLLREAWLPLTLTAALPAASNVSLLADRYGADGARIARVILGSTALAFVSFSALVGWLAPT